MKPQSHSKKRVGIIIAVIIVAALGYFYMSGDAVPMDTNTLEVQTANADGARILSLLNQIQSLRIDTGLLSSPAYVSLVDYSVNIPEIPVGRPNPFAPIPGVSIQNQTASPR
jgi:hypothetical protein